MNEIKFTKMHGQGNDFVMIDSVGSLMELSGETIAKICDRHFGVGADGLILVKKSQNADFFMDYYNQDGTTAEMCGNGIRCMAGFIITRKLSNKNNFNIDTRAGIKKIQISNNRSRNESLDIKTDRGHKGDLLDFISIKVDMGSPFFEPEKIPVKIGDYLKNKNTPDKINAHGGAQTPGIAIYDYPLNACGRIFKINCVSMGNPHCVIFLENNIGISSVPVAEWGSAIENHPLFPKKTNVEFIKIQENEIFMRVWERGVGETLACGTGACASAVCSMALNKIEGSKVKVNLPGGVLDISWIGNNSSVFLEGKVNIVFEGSYFFKD